MKKLILKLLIIVGLTTGLYNNTAYSQVTLQWAKGIGGIGSDLCFSIAVDASGNVYTIGRFQGTVDFDPGVGTNNLIAAGGWDIFISKLDATGNFVWAKSMGGAIDDYGQSIAVDASGNVYITGYFQDTADFDPSASTSILISAGSYDIFISKFDIAGNFAWANRVGGTSSDFGLSIAFDDSGNVYSTGSFSGDIYISKLDAAGNFVWAKVMAGTGDRGQSIAVDTSGNVYTTGYFRGTVDFDPDTGTSNLTSAGSRDIFVSKLDAAGNFIWAKGMGGTDFDDSYSIAVDASGNVYTTGHFESTADFDPGAGISNLTSAGYQDIFISKLDASGNFVWAKSMRGTVNEYGTSITVDASGNIYNMGSFYGTVDFDPGAGTSNLTSAGDGDIFISKLDASGNFVWAKSMGGTFHDWGNSIAVDASGIVYATGYFESTVDFDPGAGISNLTSVGLYDVFVHKMSQNTVGVTEIYSASMVNVYPNPTTGIINIVSIENVTIEIEILNAFGQIVYKDILTGDQYLNLGDFVSGVYFLKATSNSKTQFIKIIKQ